MPISLTFLDNRAISRYRVRRVVPVVLFGQLFWEKVIGFASLIEAGMIARRDLDLFSYVTSAEEAWETVHAFYDRHRARLWHRRAPDPDGRLAANPQTTRPLRTDESPWAAKRRQRRHHREGWPSRSAMRGFGAEHWQGPCFIAALPRVGILAGLYALAKEEQPVLAAVHMVVAAATRLIGCYVPSAYRP